MVLKAGSAAEPWRIRFRKQRVTGNLGAQAGVSLSPLPHPLFVPSPSLPSKILLDIFASLLQSLFIYFLTSFQYEWCKNSNTVLAYRFYYWREPQTD